MFLNQRGAEFSFFYTKRSSSTYTFKLTKHLNQSRQLARGHGTAHVF